MVEDNNRLLESKQNVIKEISKLVGDINKHPGFMNEINKILDAMGIGQFRYSASKEGELVVNNWNYMENTPLCEFYIKVEQEGISIQGFWPHSELGTPQQHHQVYITPTKDEGLNVRKFTKVTDVKDYKHNIGNYTIENAKYDPHGVVFDRDIIHFEPSEEDRWDDVFKNTEYLKEAIKCFDDKSYIPAVPIEERISLIRDSIDIASISYYSISGDKYCAKIPLNLETLKNLEPKVTEEPFPTEIVIPQISLEEIRKMLELEPDPNVRAGLEEWAKGRSEMDYDSSKDPNFVCIKNNKTRS